MAPVTFRRRPVRSWTIQVFHLSVRVSLCSVCAPVFSVIVRVSCVCSCSACVWSCVANTPTRNNNDNNAFLFFYLFGASLLHSNPFCMNTQSLSPTLMQTQVHRPHRPLINILLPLPRPPQIPLPQRCNLRTRSFTAGAQVRSCTSSRPQSRIAASS